jgi:glycosyltransferase involved in cell wall biosynthesis
LARGGNQPFGAEVWGTARALGLEVMEPDAAPLDTAAWRECLRAASTADIVHFPWVLDSRVLRMLYAASDAVLANSSFEPFGLAGLEAMDAGAVVLTGVTGEDYARPYENSLPVESEDAREMTALLGLLERDPAFAARLRREAQRTAAEYRWPRVVDGLLRRLEILALCSGDDAASLGEGLGR